MFSLFSKQRLTAFAGFSLMVLTIVSCGGSSSGSSDTDTTPTASISASDVVSNYVTIVTANYTDTISAAQDLKDAVDAFLADPTVVNFKAAQKAWKAAREPYGQTEAFRFYDGPIDNPVDGPEGYINAWPLDEGYIDYVEGNATSGIINDTSIAMTEENLLDANERDGDDTISTGFHAIEFLLWGQDLNAAPGDAGMRPYTDFITGSFGTHANQDRRATYLGLVADLLVEHLTEVNSKWVTNGSYRNEFLALNAQDALKRIIIGVGSLAGGELSGERLSVALVTKDQEDEHSCFSDNTHRDIALNFQGVLNVYNGTYTRTDGSISGNGAGLRDLIEAVNPTLAASMSDQLDRITTLVQEISDLALAGTPFDEQIKGSSTSENRLRIQEVVDTLAAFVDNLSLAADALGIDINLE